MRLQKASAPTRFVRQLLEGAAKPVGGSAEATIQLTTNDEPAAHHSTILQEARQLAHQAKNGRSETTPRTSAK